MPYLVLRYSGGRSGGARWGPLWGACRVTDSNMGGQSSRSGPSPEPKACGRRLWGRTAPRGTRRGTGRSSRRSGTTAPIFCFGLWSFAKRGERGRRATPKGRQWGRQGAERQPRAPLENASTPESRSRRRVGRGLRHRARDESSGSLPLGLSEDAGGPGGCLTWGLAKEAGGPHGGT